MTDKRVAKLDRDRTKLYKLYLFCREQLLEDSSAENQMFHKRLMALKIWDLPQIKSGFMSEELFNRLEAGELYRNIGTGDHRNSGVMIRNHLFDTDKLFSLEEFKTICSLSVVTNAVLKTENSALRPFQSEAKFEEYREYYAKAGIKLVEFEGRLAYDKPSKLIRK